MAGGTGPLFEHPPFQAAQRRQVEKVDVETKSLSELLRTEKSLVVDGEELESTISKLPCRKTRRR